MASFYDLLGVPVDASAEELHRAYRAAARRLHPDAAGDDEAMRELNRAYAVLRDPDLRAEYDASLWVEPVLFVPSRWVRRAPVIAVLAVLLAIFVLTAYAAVPANR